MAVEDGGEEKGMAACGEVGSVVADMLEKMGLSRRYRGGRFAGGWTE